MITGIQAPSGESVVALKVNQRSLRGLRLPHMTNPVRRSKELSPAAKLLLDTPRDDNFDRYTQLVAELFKVPVSLISVLDEDRQFFKSMEGLSGAVAELRQTPLSHSFCLNVVEHGEPLMVGDARLDPRFSANRAVPELGVIAYAGAPIHDENGNPFAALCAIDSRPREWSSAEMALLRILADQVSNEVRLLEKVAHLGLDLRAAEARVEAHRMAGLADRHDLRTPLNSLLLGLQGLREFGPLNADQAECLAASLRGAQELLALVDQMLDIGAVDAFGQTAMNKRPIRLAALCSQAHDKALLLAREKRIALEVELPPPDATLEGDEEKLGRVLVNLLANAVKFTQPGGRVFLSGEVAGSDAILSVKDSGVGLAAADLALLFSEGFRADREAPTRRSTGLGLTFCKRIIEAHGGTIRAESELGIGSTFTVTLPGCAAGSA
jgi:signal transduction histidine kinase